VPGCHLVNNCFGLEVLEVRRLTTAFLGECYIRNQRSRETFEQRMAGFLLRGTSHENPKGATLGITTLLGRMGMLYFVACQTASTYPHQPHGCSPRCCSSRR